MTEKKLKSGRKVLIKEMTIDDIDECKDMVQIIFDSKGLPSTVNGVNRQRTNWIRKGLGGGDFKDWKNPGRIVPDSVLKQLTDVEKEELSSLIQEEQTMGE
tara:strand:- start:575 stop:877 length:303 start_codon:yes stop_codon:yes gene_type:complete